MFRVIKRSCLQQFGDLGGIFDNLGNFLDNLLLGVSQGYCKDSYKGGYEGSEKTLITAMGYYNIYIYRTGSDNGH